MKLALAQVDPIVGDLEGNRELILARIEEAKTAGADLVLLPELAVTGYPPEDLLLRPAFPPPPPPSPGPTPGETRGTGAPVGPPPPHGGPFNRCPVCPQGS